MPIRMSGTPTPAQKRLDALRLKEHSGCFVCGKDVDGIGIRFVPGNDSSVEATFECGEMYQGYDGMIHGGIISSVLDAAMTQCMFAQGEVAVTAELCVQFKRPLATGRPAAVTARIVKDYCPLFLLEARIEQDGLPAATATGKFMRRE